MRGKYPDRIRSLPKYGGRFDAHRLAADGADVLFASYPAGTTIDVHTHDTDNYGIITRGELQLTVAGETNRFGIGDWYHVAAGTPHSAAFDVDTDEIEFWFAVESH